MFKSSEQRDAEPILDTGHSGRSAGHDGRADRAGLRRAAGAGGDGDARPRLVDGRARRPGPPDESVHVSVARIVDIYARLDLVQRFLAGVTAIRTTLTTTQSFLPLTEPGRVAGVRRRAARRAAAGRGRRASAQLTSISDRLTATPGPSTRRPSWPRRRRRSSPATATPTPRRSPAWPTSPASRPSRRLRRASTKRLREGHPALATLLLDCTTIHSGRPGWPSGTPPGTGAGPTRSSRPAPARPRAAARGGAGRHGEPAAPGDRRRWPRPGPGGTACAG